MAVRERQSEFTFHVSRQHDHVLAEAENILRNRLERLGSLGSPEDSASFLRFRLGGLEHEEFHAVWLDNRHRIIAVDRLFAGTIDACAVPVREVVKTALRRNAAAAVFAHNHPSGDPTPSQADWIITTRLKDALSLVDVRVLDHVVVAAGGTVSLAQRGWL